MQIQFVAKGVDFSEALKERAANRIESGVAKYFNRPGEALATVTKSGSQFRMSCSLHLPSGILFQTSGEGEDAYAACDAAMERMEKRLRRYSNRMKDHNPGLKALADPESLPVTVFESRARNEEETGDEEEAPDGDPVIIAESSGELRELSVSNAVAEMELSDAPFLLFRNEAHGDVNIVYRRPDGHIGWLAPNRRDAKTA